MGGQQLTVLNHSGQCPDGLAEQFGKRGNAIRSFSMQRLKVQFAFACDHDIRRSDSLPEYDFFCNNLEARHQLTIQEAEDPVPESACGTRARRLGRSCS